MKRHRIFAGNGTAIFIGLALLGACKLVIAQDGDVDARYEQRNVPSTTFQMSPIESLLTRKGSWKYQWKAGNSSLKLEDGDLQAVQVRFFSDGTYDLDAHFLRASAVGTVGSSNNKGLWSISRSMYASIITHGPAGQLPVFAPGILAQVKSIEPGRMVLSPLQGKFDMVFEFQSNE